MEVVEEQKVSGTLTLEESEKGTKVTSTSSALEKNFGCDSGLRCMAGNSVVCWIELEPVKMHYIVLLFSSGTWYAVYGSLPP